MPRSSPRSSSAGLTSRTTFFIVSDHGFKLVKRQIRLNAAFMKAGLLKAHDGKIVQSDAYVVPEGGSAIVYLTVAGPDWRVARSRAARRLPASRASTPSSSLPTTESFGLPQPSENNQMGVLFVTPKDGYSFTAAVGEDVVVDATEGSLGAHGYPTTDPDLSALFIASGAGIAPGIKLDVDRQRRRGADDGGDCSG